ncbi:MAG: hypothetical protein KDA05_06000 [Phycisphaerales bacterium]|nr:hypothetical protein [Phycisphaerales bacterium]MCB9840254.1 hypothetical protein [Phycisphaeraceae bacterium]
MSLSTQIGDEGAARLKSLLDKARAKSKGEPHAPPAVFAGEDGVVVELVRSMLWWESGRASADAAMASLGEQVVDLNELRVFLADELAAMLGPDDPRAQERAERLRACLNDVFAREHDVRLAHLAEEGKRDIRAYFESLDGMHPFVAARLVLLCFGGHAFPIDARLRDCLAKHKVVPPETPPGDAGSWMERQFRAGEAAEAYLLLEACAEQAAKRSASRRGGSSKPAASRSKKKAPAKPRKRSGAEK